MGRKLRYLPEEGALVEVTCRTLQGRLLLRPSPELNDIAAGVLGRAQRLYPVDLIALSLLSNHYHMLVRAESAKRLARFVGYFNSNLAREVSRLTGWTGKIWDRRYQAILISNEEEVQVARFRYVLSHGVKENLVAHLREWPGLQSVRQLADGEPLAGTWFDRTQEYLARRKGETADRLRHTTPETVTFSLLPCWKNLSPEAHRQRVANMAAEIEEDAAAARKRTGTEPFGVAAILAQAPTSRPKRLKKSPAPLFHAASQAMRHYFYEGFSWFVAAYRTAAEKLQKGDPDPRFPIGSFPPALPFVGG
ncbi:MAG TPA: transposase [Thermoanaerobaculia bacterium]|jgi:REP element-mobilizing transposase RayT|nr:transposase [Thermoanaerobaculia bacterium]